VADREQLRAELFTACDESETVVHFALGWAIGGLSLEDLQQLHDATTTFARRIRRRRIELIRERFGKLIDGE